MFNEKNPNTYLCPTCGRTHYKGEASYIKSVKWDDFYSSKKDFNKYIAAAIEIKSNINNYTITKNI